MKALLPLIRGASTLLIAAHKDPEGDAIGSTLALGLALEQQGKEVTFFNEDPLPYNLGFLPGVSRLRRALAPGETFDLAVVLDCGEAPRLGQPFLLQPPPFRALINIDHHPTNPGFGPQAWIDAQASSTGEMVYKLLQALAAPIDRRVATCLYTAIFTDTGSFRYGNTTPLALRQAAELLELGVDPWLVAQNVYETQPLPRLQLIGAALSTLEFWPECATAAMTLTRAAQQQFESEAGFSDGIINYPRSLRGAEVAALFRELPDGRVKVSFRSRGAFDVAALCQSFGGGGHRQAAGCTLCGTLPAVQKTIRAALAQRYQGETK